MIRNRPRPRWIAPVIAKVEIDCNSGWAKGKWAALYCTSMREKNRLVEMPDLNVTIPEIASERPRTFTRTAAREFVVMFILYKG